MGDHPYLSGDDHGFAHAHGLFHDHGDEDDESTTEAELSEIYAYSGDSIELVSVGIDIGSSTSHLIFSRLELRRLGQNLSSRYVVVSREIIYRSPILLTPYTTDYSIDAERLGAFAQEAYEAADFTPDQIDTGAIILTGEAVKRRNARAIGDLFASESGKFVCASAGHNLEAIMAAHGSGAALLSRDSGQVVLNVDVGGGTSKLAVIRRGEILETAATNVGGRLIALGERGEVVRIEPAARRVAEAIGVPLELNAVLSEPDRVRIAEALADCLVSAIRGERGSELADQLWVTPRFTASILIDAITFSGGVSEYLYGREQADFGDLAVPLAAAIRARIDAGALPAPIQAGGERIRATVIGASQFTVQVSGNTISISRPDLLPIHNLQVLYPRLPLEEDARPAEIGEAIAASFRRFDIVEGEHPVALALDWSGTPRYARLRALADGITAGLPNTVATGRPLVLVFNGDIGRAIGSILREDLGLTNEVISIDGIDVREFDFVDIGEMLHPSRAVPVVIKSLVFPDIVDARAELAESSVGG
jgi:ethanolamine utilization protein EutA